MEAVGEMALDRTSVASGRSVDPAEVARFTAQADAWWDPAGKFKPLHKLNPVRISFIRSRLTVHFHRDAHSLRPFSGLRLLDVGCGGGLLSEPMARLGFEVVGVDAGARNIAAARIHAEAVGLAIEYRAAAAEELAEAGERFDVVLNMEVVEHVADLRAFLATTASLVKPGGVMLVATLNRTQKAWLLAVIGAEYILGWLPRGTHHWRKFVRPSELAAGLRAEGLRIEELTGVRYDPVTGGWTLDARDLDVNYMALATKPHRA
jgi:2-polyprenyl-6-hydroxyphenyl methylase / 3-demethylubiquinone-9 3-methyltransferase